MSDTFIMENNTSSVLKKIDNLESEGLVKKIMNKIPVGILDSGIYGELTEIKVKYKFGQDNELYASNKDLQTYVPRGLTYLTLYKKDEEVIENDFVISGLSKFAGTPADDDNSSKTDVTYELFSEPMETATKIVSIEKINGEAAHFTARLIGGVVYLIAGSKFTHLIFNCEEHIELYTDTKYDLAKKIAKTVLKYWENLDNKTMSEFSSYLIETKCTIICEYLQPSYQHIVSLDHLEEDTLVAFTISPPITDSIDERSFTIQSPEETINFLQKFNLNTPSYEVFPIHSLNNQIEEVRNTRLNEGRVFYFVNEQDNKTIGLMKVKTKWYILLRACREKTIRVFYSKHKNPIVSFARSEMERRLEDLKLWLNLTDDEMRAWNVYFHGWFDFIKENESNLSAIKIRESYPLLWKRYLNESNQEEL